MVTLKNQAKTGKEQVEQQWKNIQLTSSSKGMLLKSHVLSGCDRDTPTSSTFGTPLELRLAYQASHDL